MSSDTDTIHAVVVPTELEDGSLVYAVHCRRSGVELIVMDCGDAAGADRLAAAIAQDATNFEVVPA